MEQGDVIIEKIKGLENVFVERINNLAERVSENSTCNKEEHKDIREAQAYTNGKVRGLFIWKATIIGMGIVLSAMTYYISRDYLNTKARVDDLSTKISEIQGYFIVTK